MNKEQMQNVELNATWNTASRDPNIERTKQGLERAHGSWIVYIYAVIASIEKIPTRMISFVDAMLLSY